MCSRANEMRCAGLLLAAAFLLLPVGLLGQEQQEEVVAPPAPVMAPFPTLPQPAITQPTLAAPADDAAPVVIKTDIRPEIRKVAKKKSAPPAKPAAPLDPNSSRGTTHQDPILLLGVVAAFLYRRRNHDDDFYYGPPPRRAPIAASAETPRARRVAALSWTATVPGSMMRLTNSLPQVQLIPQAIPPMVPQPAPQPAAAPGAGRRVLLVGGSPASLCYEKNALRAEGIEFVGCAPGQRAVDLLARENFSAVVVDVEMTGDDAPISIDRWLAHNRPGMERGLIITISNLCDPGTSGIFHALTLTRPCSAEEFLVIVRLAMQRGGAGSRQVQIAN